MKTWIRPPFTCSLCRHSIFPLLFSLVIHSSRCLSTSFVPAPSSKPSMESASGRLAPDEDELRNRTSIASNPITSAGNRASDSSPISAVSSSSLEVRADGDQAHAEDIISPGPVRTVQVQRHSMLGGKPRYLIADIRRQATNSHESTGSRNEEASLQGEHAHSRKYSSVSNAWLWLALLVTTSVSLAVFGFLCYLWFVRDSTWQRMLHSNWLVRGATLAATVIWLAAEGQALLAGLMLLCSQSEVLSRSPRNKEYAPLRRAPSRKVRGFTDSWTTIFLGVLILLSSFALHFASTILLSDFENGVFASGFRPRAQVPASLSDALRTNISKGEMDSSGSSLTQLPLFAEFSETVPELQLGVDDTGESVRAFLPLSTPTEEALANYNGIATLINSRVVCLIPVINNLTYTSTGPSTSPGSPAQRVRGSLGIGPDIPNGLQVNTGVPPAIEIDCGLQLAQSKGESPISMCSAQFPTSAVSVVSPFTNGMASETSAFLLLNHTENSTIPISASSGGGQAVSVSISSWDTGQSGVWANATYAPNPIFSMQLSLCFVGAGTFNADIEASGGRDRLSGLRVETTAGGSLFDVDVTTILNRLGVQSNAATDDRGLFELSHDRTWTPSANSTSPLDQSSIFGENTTYGLCTHCGSYGDGGTARGVSNAISIVFQRALQISGSPAKALQAILTLARASQYASRYVTHCAMDMQNQLTSTQRQPYFNVEGTSSIEVFEEFYHPHHYAGLAALGAILVFQTIIVVVITILFVRQSRRPLFDQLHELLGPRSSAGHSRSNSLDGD